MMKCESQEYHRRSIRLKDYDYSQTGGYFITICSHNRECLLGGIENGQMMLNAYGRIVMREWSKTDKIRTDVQMDNFVVMPNHIHGIIVVCRGVSQYAPTESTPSRFKSPSQTIGAIVRGFKSAVAKQINLLRNTPGLPVWQRNYYEHIIRDEKELSRLRGYIINNPLQWQLDRENPLSVNYNLDYRRYFEGIYER